MTQKRSTKILAKMKICEDRFAYRLFPQNETLAYILTKVASGRFGWLIDGCHPEIAEFLIRLALPMLIKQIEKFEAQTGLNVQNFTSETFDEICKSQDILVYRNNFTHPHHKNSFGWIGYSKERKRFVIWIKTYQRKQSRLETEAHEIAHLIAQKSLVMSGTKTPSLKLFRDKSSPKTDEIFMEFEADILMYWLTCNKSEVTK